MDSKLSSIDHKFPETGHSLLPYDFARIEKRKQKEQALISDDWIHIVEHSRMVEQYDIIDMKQEDIVAYKTISEKTFRTTFKDDLDHKVPISSLKWLSC